MTGGDPGELTAFGATDSTALGQIRDVVVAQEPLVETAQFDDPLNPQALQIELEDGIGAASTARIDAKWSVRDHYSFHYTDDEGCNFRFDRHPKPTAPDRHFHPPPDASSDDAVPSCIRVDELELVTRAVLKLWRRAYEAGTTDGLNTAENPP